MIGNIKEIVNQKYLPKLRKDVVSVVYRGSLETGNVASSGVHLGPQLLQNKPLAAAYCIADSKAVVRHCQAPWKKYNSDLLDPKKPQYVVIISRL